MHSPWDRKYKLVARKIHWGGVSLTTADPQAARIDRRLCSSAASPARGRGSSTGHHQPRRAASSPRPAQCRSTSSRDVLVRRREPDHKSLQLQWELGPGHDHGSPFCSPCQREQAGHGGAGCAVARRNPSAMLLIQPGGWAAAVCIYIKQGEGLYYLIIIFFLQYSRK